MLHPFPDEQDHEDVKEKTEPDLECQISTGHSTSLSACASSQEDVEAEEQISTDDYSNDVQEKQPVSKSLELARTTSNVLERVLTTKSITNPGPPPDGGFQAWTQVACGWLVILVTWGWVNSYGAFQTYYTLHLNESASTISWIGTIQNWFTFFVGAFSGRLLDAGYFRAVFLVGSIIQVVGIFLMSISSQFWQLMLTQGLMTGLGGGLFFVPAMGLMSTYFTNRRSLALGLATTGNAVGGMIYPVMVQQLLPKLGFAWTTRVLGFFNLALLTIAITFMRPRLPPRKSGPIVDWAAFADPPFAFYCAGLFFLMWPIYYTFYYIASFGVQRLHMDFSVSTTLVILINGVGVPARVIPPYLADRTGQLNIMAPVLLALAVLTYTWLAITTPAGLYVFTVFYGILSASFQCLIPSACASITPDLNMVGTRLGMMFSSLSFAALTGPPIGGALQSALDGEYWAATVWAATSTLVGAGFVVAARVSRVGWKFRMKV